VNEQTVKRFAVLAAAAGLSTWAIDMAATQVGLVSQQAALGISVTASQWILNLTLMVVAGLVTVGGALGDRVGRLRIFRLGIIVIAAGAIVTFLGGIGNVFPVVLIGRAGEGVGAALFLPAAMALLLDVYPMAERGGAQGRMMVISMTVTAFAPTIIGLIIQAINWPFTYLLTVVAAIVTFFLLTRVKYEQKKPAAAPFDYTGSVLIFVAVALLITGIMQAGTSGLTSPTVLLMVGGGLLVGLALVLLSLRKEYPLIQFRVMKIRSVAIAVFVSLMRFLPSVLAGAFVARYVQQVLGLSPTVAGLLMILPVLAQVVAAPIAGRMLDKGGARKPVSLGAAGLILGSAFLAFGFPAESLPLILIGTIIGGAGFSFMNPVQMAALSETPLAQRGMLAGIFPLASNFGTALFVALLTAGLSAFMNSYMASNPGATDAAAQSAALGTLAWITVAATFVTLAVSLLLRRPVANADATPAQPATPAVAK
jgi:MFS family permease